MTEQLPDPISALGEVDPKRVGDDEFIALLQAASDLAASGVTADLGVLRPEQFARLISRASTKQLTAIMQRPELRERILDEVFRRMGEHYRASGTEAVVRWRIGTGDDDYLRYECVLSGDTCVVNRQPECEPSVTLTLSPVDFVKLASGNASGPALFIGGKLKVVGDLALAARLSNLFQIPKA